MVFFNLTQEVQSLEAFMDHYVAFLDNNATDENVH